MVSVAGGFATGLERGMRLGMASDESKYKKSERARLDKERDREDRINAEVGQAFAKLDTGWVATPAAEPVAMPEPTGLGAAPGAKPAAMPSQAPMGAVPGAKPAEMPGLESQQPRGQRPGRQQQPDFVGQLNGAMGYLAKAAQDPKNADIAAALFDKMGVLANSSKRFGDVMLQQARQKAMPHIKALYNPGATDEQKTAAVGALMNEVFPDGETYQPKVIGKEVHLLDPAGKPVMGPDGKPRVLSMDEVDEMLTYGLSTPDDYIASVQESIKTRRERLIEKSDRDEEWARDDLVDKRDYERKRRDELADMAREEGLEKQQQDREERREITAAIRDHVAKGMLAYDRDVASMAIAKDPKARDEFRKNLNEEAKSLYGGGESRPSRPTGPQPGENIDVDVDVGLDTAPPRAEPAAAATEFPPVLMPGQATAPTGPSGATYNPQIGKGVQEISEALDALEGWKEKRRTSGFRSMGEKFRQGVSAGKVDPALVQRLRTVPDRVLARDYGLSPKEIAAIKQGG